jgi:C-terminal processing protease CtpA/Prc
MLKSKIPPSAGKSLIPIALTMFVALLVMVYSVPVHGESAKLKIQSEAGKYERSTKQGWLGVYVQEITEEIREAMDLKSEEGVLVRDVVEDSPAEKAGIKKGDVILVFNQEKVDDPEHLIGLVRKTSPGNEVELLIVRDGKEKTLIITMGETPGNKLRESEFPGLEPRKGEPQVYKFFAFSGRRIGVRVEDLTAQLGDYFGVKDGEGALITEVDEEEPAYKAGLRAGDVIVEVDEEKIEDTEDLISAISGKEEGDKVEIKVIRDRKPQSFTVEVEEGKEQSSVYLKKLEKLRILPENLPEPNIFWEEKEFRQPQGELRKELEKLKEQMKELKEELEDLKEELK